MKALVRLASAGIGLRQGLLRLELLDEADDSGGDENEQKGRHHDRHGLVGKRHLQLRGKTSRVMLPEPR